MRVSMGGLLRTVVSGTAVGILLWRLSPDNLWSALQNFDTRQLLPAMACMLAMLAVRAYKWRELLADGDSRGAFRSLFGGFVLGLFLPGRVGELGRCVFSRENQRARVALLNILDRALDSWALVTFGVASLFFLVPWPPALFGLGVWLAILPVVMGLPTLIAHLASLPRWSARWRACVAEVAPQLSRVQTSRFAILSLGSTALDLLLFYYLLRGFCDVDLSVALATFPGIVIAGGLPLAFSGLGLREGAAALLLANFGVPAAAAIETGLLTFAFSVLLPGLLSGVWLLADGRWPKLPKPLNFRTLFTGDCLSPVAEAAREEQ